MRAAENFIAGRILQGQPSPGTNEVLRRLTEATGVGGDKILSRMPQLLRDAAGIYARYTVEPARTCDFLVPLTCLRGFVYCRAPRGYGVRKETRTQR
jgi:hypothetical protein